MKPGPKPKNRHKADPVEKLERYLSQYQRRAENLDIMDIDDVIGAEIAPVLPEPTHEVAEPVEVRPWYRCGVEAVECSFGECHFGIPYNASPKEIEIVKAARQRVIDEIERGYERRRQERESLRAEWMRAYRMRRGFLI